MNPTSAREALLAEALGDIAALVDRLDTLLPALGSAQQAVADAGKGLGTQLEALEDRLAVVTETARTQVVQHIVQRTEAAARRAQELQTRAMAAAARELFKAEVDQALQGLVAASRAMARRTSPAWVAWLTHGAAALGASALTWMMMVSLWVR